MQFFNLAHIFFFVCWPIAFRIRAISNYFIFNRTPLIFWCQSLRMFINVFILTVKMHNEAYFVRLSFWFCQCFKISCCITFKIHNALCINILLFFSRFFFSSLFASRFRFLNICEWRNFAYINKYFWFNHPRKIRKFLLLGQQNFVCERVNLVCSDIRLSISNHRYIVNISSFHTCASYDLAQSPLKN